MVATVIWLAIIAIVIYAICWFAKRKNPPAQVEDRLVGVGGWLLLLVVGLTFLGPVMGAGGLASGMMSAESQYPKLKALENWATFKEVTWWSYFVVVCLSFYAGFGLAATREYSAVRRAKVLLWIVGPVAAVVLGMFVPLLIFGKIQYDSQFFGQLVGSGISAAIWTAYLSKSKRVQATYAATPPPGST